jgi:hypothetical protein
MNNPLILSLLPGTYTVTGTYNNVQKNASVSVSAGSISNVTLNLGGSLPSSLNNGSDFIGWLTGLLASSTLKGVMFIFDAMLAGISGIMLFVPEKHRYEPPPRHY